MVGVGVGVYLIELRGINGGLLRHGAALWGCFISNHTNLKGENFTTELHRVLKKVYFFFSSEFLRVSSA
jgi:hypothetical protein